METAKATARGMVMVTADRVRFARRQEQEAGAVKYKTQIAERRWQKREGVM